MQESIQPLLLTIPQVAKTLNLGRTKVYHLIATKQLPVMHFGRAVRVSSSVAAKRWIEQQEQHDELASVCVGLAALSRMTKAVFLMQERKVTYGQACDTATAQSTGGNLMGVG